VALRALVREAVLLGLAEPAVLVALAAPWRLGWGRGVPVRVGGECAAGTVEEFGSVAVADDREEVRGRVADARGVRDLGDDELDLSLGRVEPGQDQARVGGGAGQSRWF